MTSPTTPRPELGGRTPEHWARNEQACEVIADAIVILLCLGAGGYLLALIFGWGR